MLHTLPLDVLGIRTHQEKDVRKQNAQAINSVAKILQSSLGPNGLDKMIVDNLGEMNVTNDGATIMELLETEHPAAKVLVDLAKLQDKEVGDGTTSIVLIAAELISRAQKLISNGLHPIWVLSAYKLAGKEAVKFIQKNLCKETGEFGDDIMYKIAETSLKSKLVAGKIDFFAKIVVDAIKKVKQVDASGKTRYPVKAVAIHKTHGRSLTETKVVNGYALARIGRASQKMPKKVENARIAMLNFPLKQYRAPLGVEISISEPAELEKIRLMEKNISKERTNLVIKSGANVVFTSEGIDDMVLKYFEEANILVIRRVPQEDLRRIARSVGASVMLTMANMDSDEEQFSSENLGYAELVYESRVGDWDYIFIENAKLTKCSCIILRGANEYMLNEIERCLHDALCVCASTLEKTFICAGGGAVETALHLELERFSRTQEPKLQAAINEYAEALLIIPKLLAANGALDTSDIIAKLKYKHMDYYNVNSKDALFYGLDLSDGEIKNNFKCGIVEPAVVKTKTLRFATETAITLCRVDDLIKCEPIEKPHVDECSNY